MLARRAVNFMCQINGNLFRVVLADGTIKQMRLRGSSHAKYFGRKGEQTTNQMYEFADECLCVFYYYEYHYFGC